MLNLKIAEAKTELASKTYRQIQEETATKWAARAGAAYEMVVESELKSKLATWTLAEEFYHESIEHAALTEDDGKILASIREALKPLQEKAAENIGNAFGQLNSLPENL